MLIHGILYTLDSQYIPLVLRWFSGRSSLRGQSPLIALILMISVVLAMSVGLVAFFNYQYSKVSSERARIEALSRIPANIAITPVYSESSGNENYCHMIEVTNIGSSQITFWIAFGVGYIDDRGYPRLTGDDIQRVVIVKTVDGLLSLPQCPGDLPGQDVTSQSIQVTRVYTADEWNLAEIGNPPAYTLKGFTKITLNPRESKTLYIVAQTTGNAWTLALVMTMFNDKLYLVSLHKLPS